jgi:hypothetical protein
LEFRHCEVIACEREKSFSQNGKQVFRKAQLMNSSGAGNEIVAPWEYEGRNWEMEGVASLT